MNKITPSSMAAASIPSFRPYVGAAAQGGSAQGVPSSPRAYLTPDGNGEVATRQLPLGSVTNGFQPVYTTTRRWTGVDVYLSLAATGNVFGAANGLLCVALYAVNQGIKTLVAKGFLSQLETAQGLNQKHILRYRGGVAEKFEIQYAINALITPPSSAMLQFAIAASDGAVAPPALEDDDAGTVLMPGNQGLGACWVPVGGEPLVLRGVVAASALTPRFLHIHDLATIAASAGQVPLYAFALAVGGNSFYDPLFAAHRFSLGICPVISTTAAITTLVGVEDSAVQRTAFR